MRKLIEFSLALLALASFGDAARVLVVFTFPGKSHSILGEGIVRNLAGAGHEVTFITPFKPSKQHKNTRIIDVSSVYDTFQDFFASRVNISAILSKEADLNSMGPMLDVLPRLGRVTLEDKNMKILLTDPTEKFDVIIIEWMFLDLLAGLQAVFQCPYIWFSSVDPHSSVTKLVDERLNPAYTADLHSDDSPPYGFIDRTKELFKSILTSAFRAFYLWPIEEKIYKDLLVPIIEKKGYEVPAFDTVVHNASLVLGNSHVSMGESIRLPQNYKPIAGYHIDVNVEPLPEDLRKLMDAAKNGVIYFSMGSNLKSKDMPNEMKKELLKLFAELKYTVIWKFEETLADLPKNVHILQWAPQPSILAHPNCKLFITHGGFLSTTEAVHYGVPIIGIPVFADQFLNIKRAENRGFAIKVDLSYSLHKDLKVAIENILATFKYREKMKELSAIYHERPVPPGKELVHWVEHVVRTRGAVHLRSPALHVPWYQKMFLDLALTLLVVLTIIVYLFKKLCSAICSKKKAVNSKKNN